MSRKIPFVSRTSVPDLRGLKDSDFVDVYFSDEETQRWTIGQLKKVSIEYLKKVASHVERWRFSNNSMSTHAMNYVGWHENIMHPCQHGIKKSSDACQLIGNHPGTFPRKFFRPCTNYFAKNASPCAWITKSKID